LPEKERLQTSKDMTVTPVSLIFRVKRLQAFNYCKSNIFLGDFIEHGGVTEESEP
jgi:hypothetical protein